MLNKREKREGSFSSNKVNQTTSKKLDQKYLLGIFCKTKIFQAVPLKTGYKNLQLGNPEALKILSVPSGS